MFRKFYYNQITGLLTRFVVATLLVVVLSGVAAPTALAADAGSAVGNFIGNIILTVGASAAKMGGLALDFSVDTLVVGMGDLVNGEQLKGAVNSMWTVIRDICNLAFIFAFIYVGIRTILDADNAGTKRLLAQIIIAALLINFSLLFTKIIIDFSNLTAIAVKEAMMPNSGTFSTNFVQQLGLSGIYGKIDANILENMTKGGGLWYSLLGTLFLLFTAFVFVAGAVLLVVRFVALIFIMIFSPILFAATIFPQTSQYASKLWSTLFSYSFFAPAYFLLLLISMRVIEAVKPINGGYQLADAIPSGDVTMSGSVIVFIIATIFMLQSLLLAQKLGVAGGNMAVSVGNKIRGGMQGFAGRITFGRAGEWASRKQKELREGDSKWGRAGAMALRGTGINAAASAASTAKWGGSTSRVDAKKETEEIARARAKSGRVAEISKSISASTEASRVAALPGASTAQIAAANEAKIKMERSIEGATTEQMLALMKEHKKKPSYNDIVTTMSASQYDSIMKSKSEDFDDAEKAALTTARASAIKTKIESTAPAGTAGPFKLRATIGKASAKDLDALDFNDVLENAQFLSTKQMDDMSLTPTAKSTLKARRDSDLIARFSVAGGLGAASVFSQFREAEASKLPNAILTHPNAAPHLNVKLLTKMLDNESLSALDRADIKRNVLGYHTGAALAPYTAFFSSEAGRQY